MVFLLPAFLVTCTGCAMDTVPGHTGNADASPAHDVISAPDVPGRSPAPGLCGFDPNLPWSPLGEILQLADAHDTTCVWLQRRNECEGICKAVPFTLEAMRIGHDGAVVDIRDPQALSWHSTHHNWCDRGEALTRTVRYQLRIHLTSDFDYVYTITAVERASGAELWSAVMAPFAAAGTVEAAAAAGLRGHAGGAAPVVTNPSRQVQPCWNVPALSNH